MDDERERAVEHVSSGREVLACLRLLPSGSAELSGSAQPPDPGADDVHITLLGGARETRTLCDLRADPDLVEPADRSAGPCRYCLRCVARAAELGYPTVGDGR